MSVPRAPIVALFGANDAGKTNTLEAIEHATATESRHLRLDPLSGEPEEYEFSALIELDGLQRAGDADADVFAGLLQVRHLPPMFPWRSEAGDVLAADAVDPATGEDRHPPALLRWPVEGIAQQELKVSFWIGCVGEQDEWFNQRDLGTLADAKAALRERATSAECLCAARAVRLPLEAVVAGGARHSGGAGDRNDGGDLNRCGAEEFRRKLLPKLLPV